MMRSQSEQEHFDQGVKMVEEMMEAIVITGSDKYMRATIEGMLHAFIHEHRTLQQSFVRQIAMMLVAWVDGNKEAFTDGRNEAAWAFAQQIRDLHPHFPLRDLNPHFPY